MVLELARMAIKAFLTTAFTEGKSLRGLRVYIPGFDALVKNDRMRITV